MLYTGLGRQMQMHPFDFMQATRLVGRNYVVYRDLFNQFYQRGIGPDVSSLPAFLEWQAKVRARFPWTRKLYCLGPSGGGYAAVLSGYLLGADIVWGFAPLVTPPSEALVPRETHGLPPETYERYTDLAKLLREGNGKTEYRIYYNHAHAPDREAISGLEGLPGVSLFPQGGRDHFVVPELAKTGILAELLPAFEET